MAGDKFNARVSVYYYGENFNPDHPVVEREEMATSLLEVLSGGLSPLGNENGGSELLNSLIGPENFAFPYNEIVNTMTDPTAPRAYLNYVLFDEEFHVNAEKSGVLQVTSAKKGTELFKFTKTAAAHMEEAARMIPIQILDDIIKTPMQVLKDPKGTNALMHYSQMWKNSKLYNV